MINKTLVFVLLHLASCLAVAANHNHSAVMMDDRDLAQQLRQALERKGGTYQPRTEHFDDDGNPTYTNRLILEDSPYLLQHAHNPVNWFPWGQEAFARAKQQNKLVLLSIGYATCHWCHVMERESFEDEEIAAKLNEHFIAIKVDREQLPDIDATYMTAVQMLTGSGGWPLNMFLTADAKPFHGGTYFPPALFNQLLDQVLGVWLREPERVHEFSVRLSEAIASANALSKTVREVGDREVYVARQDLLATFDDLQGGFGDAPKFPRAPVLAFLLELAHRNGDSEAKSAAEFTLQRITAGGIHDHVGGGFHRYAVDPDWLIPHFEKMLYNQAWMVSTLIKAHHLSANSGHARAAKRTLDYVIREMTNDAGGFYSATDADSEGAEGTYFIWSMDELTSVLGDKYGEFAATVFGSTESGNFERKNILRLSGTVSEVAADLNLEVSVLTDKLDQITARLLANRKLRVPPITDRKVITEWNAMMATALVEGYEAFDDPRYLQAALRSINFLWEHNQYDNGRLMRAFFNGNASIQARQADYAYLARTLVAVFDVTGDPIWLDRAESLVQNMDELFWDSLSGGYFIGSKDVGGAALPSRPKDLFDNAIATGNAIALQTLARLWHRTGADKYRNRAEELLNAFSGSLEKSPSAFAYLLVGAMELLNGETGARQYAGRGKVKVDASAANDKLTVSVSVAQGWHINATEPLQDYLIGTRLDSADGSTQLTVSYPQSVRRKLGFQSEELALYEGRFEISALVANTDKALHEIDLQLQACSDEICLAPETLSLKIPNSVTH